MRRSAGRGEGGPDAGRRENFSGRDEEVSDAGRRENFSGRGALPLDRAPLFRYNDN